MPKSTRHRSAKSGKFVTAKTAKRRPATTVRERVKRPKGKVYWVVLLDGKYTELFATKRDAALDARWSGGGRIARVRVIDIGSPKRKTK